MLLVAAFIAGYLQGTVRGLLGIAVIVFSLILAAQIRGPFGDFLAGNWTQFPADYSRMLAFALVFVVATFAFVIIVENFYERSPVMPRYPLVDPILGGVLGVIEGGIGIGAVVMILDSYFRGAGLVLNPNELLFLCDFHHAIDVSQAAKIYRHDLIPGFFLILGGFIPEDVRALFPR